MGNGKDVIQQFVDRFVIAKRDYQLLDVLWVFSYCLPSKTGYEKHREDFKRWLGTVCKRNLQKKHNLSLLQIREKMNTFIGFINGMPDFLNYETYYEDAELLQEILMSKTYLMLSENTEQRLEAITSDLDEKILSFVLHYIPGKIQESLQKAEEFKAVNEFYNDKYMVLSDFHIQENKETGEISHFTANTREWTYLFNEMFDEELKEYRFKSKSYSNRSGLFLFSSYEQYAEHSFWQFGDELVNLGVGYWGFSLSAKGNVTIDFIIPKLIYDAIQPYKEKLPQIEDIVGKVSEITMEKEKADWALGDLAEDVEVVSEFSESDIEHSIVSNPNVLEDDLEVVGRQFPTAVGFIDILCRDKNESFVVVELKKGAGSFEVVGQIQKYMAWVHENLAGTKQVRGMIVVSTHDEQLEYAIKGSKFTIEIKVFGEEAPTLDNIKYCDNCGKPNRKSAKYCVKCGKELWL